MRRRKQIRLRGYDYSLPGAYFITLCTKDRKNRLARVVNSRARRSAIGEAVSRCWKEIPDHQTGVEVDEFVVMPNHVHGVVVILDSSMQAENSGRRVQLNTPTGNRFSRISPKAGSLGVIVRTFKAAVTTWCRANGFPEFAWQRGFYEHIIRDEHSLQRIREYIDANPRRWVLDTENRERIGKDDSERWMRTFTRRPSGER